MEEDMTEALATPFPERRPARPPAPHIARARPPTASSSESDRTIEIVAPNQHCADLLVEYAAPSFRAEIVSGPPWMVRLQPPPTGGGWVPDLLKLVERWLESVPLPCTKVLYGGRNYLIRDTTDIAQFATALE
jgi:hypothetical protein